MAYQTNGFVQHLSECYDQIPENKCVTQTFIICYGLITFFFISFHGLGLMD